MEAIKTIIVSSWHGGMDSPDVRDVMGDNASKQYRYSRKLLLNIVSKCLDKGYSTLISTPGSDLYIVYISKTGFKQK